VLDQRGTKTTLDLALERMFKNFYPWWKVLKELRQSERPEDLLAEWRRSPKGTQEGRKAMFFREAIGVLAVALGLPREEAEELVWQHVTKDR
jgi:hypothetical protein